MTKRPSQMINRRDFVAGSAAMGAAIALPHASFAQETTPEAASPSSVTRLPHGYALVTSIRMPLAGIAGSQEAALIQGAISDWREVGAPVSRPVTPIAIDGLEPSGMSPAQKVADYEELVRVLDGDSGAMAVVPLEQIDFRVNTLRVDGVDPLLASGTDAAPVLRIGAAGDIIPGRNVANYIRKYDDFTMPMQRVKSVLADFDITFANFECFISETLESPELTDPGALDFLTRPQFVPGLVEAGIDAVSMANNHALYSHAGWGLPAFADTYTYLTEGGVPVFGAGMDLDHARQPWIGEANGLSVALIGIDGITGNIDYPDSPGVVAFAGSQATASHGGTNPLQMEIVGADIARLAGEHDIVIPFFHMSDQYIWTPSSWAIETAHKAIDAGATAVVSSHPHTIQGMEIYNGKPIFHGIGNFVYDQMFSVDTRQGYVLELTFRGGKVAGFRTHGVEIEAFSQPRFMSPGEQASLMDRFWNATDVRIRNMG
jgi:poly-gamma-glutamate capsule biosynthesis protein CapA/YwtB (metallophosphatase superfamily)